jgi:hypothetical protein
VTATVTRDITIGSSTYRIGQFSARDGSWIVSQFITRMLLLDPAKASDEKNLAFILSTTLSELPEDKYNQVREKCLAVCSEPDSLGAAIPLLMRDGSSRWASKNPPDLVAQNALLIGALVFNLSPFFDPGALETLRQIYPDLSQYLPGSTDSSSAPSQPDTGAIAK